MIFAGVDLVELGFLHLASIFIVITLFFQQSLIIKRRERLDLTYPSFQYLQLIVDIPIA